MKPAWLNQVGWIAFGLAFIIAGVIVLRLNRWGAELGINFQGSIGSPMTGKMSYWFFRGCGVVLGVGFLYMGAMLVLGYR